MRSRRASDGTNGLGSPPGVLRLEQPSGRINDPVKVIVGIESDRGLWVTAWAAAGYQVYAINPLGASRYRDRHNVGGAKSGPGDAKMLADLVPTDRHNHRQIAGDTPEAEAIRIVARGHQNLIWSRNRQTNALRDALREYYSAALETFAELADSGAPGVLACWHVGVLAKAANRTANPDCPCCASCQVDCAVWGTCTGALHNHERTGSKQAHLGGARSTTGEAGTGSGRRRRRRGGPGNHRPR
jgi:hypothetical protein